MPVTAEEIRSAYNELGAQPIQPVPVTAPPAAAPPPVAAPPMDQAVQDAYNELARETNAQSYLNTKTPSYSYNPAELDDRTTLQKYGLGVTRQVAAGLMDLGLGLAGMGIRWSTAALLAPMRLLPDQEIAPILQTAKAINDYVGQAMRWSDVVAGRPVLSLPESIPLIGGQDLFRLAAPFALPTIGAAGVAAKSEGAVARLAKVLGFNIGFMTGEPALKLATSESSDETVQALKELGVGAATGAAFTGLFAGIHAGVNKLKAVRQDYALRSMATSLAHDAIANGDTLGDGVLRATEDLRRMSGAKLTTARETLFKRLQLQRDIDAETLSKLKAGTMSPGEAAQKWLKDLNRASAASDSAVKDETGQLTPVFRGQPDITLPLDINKVSPENILPGIFFAERPRIASGYAKIETKTDLELLDKTYPEGRQIRIDPVLQEGGIPTRGTPWRIVESGGQEATVIGAHGSSFEGPYGQFVAVDVEVPSEIRGSSGTTIKRIWLPAPEGVFKQTPAGVMISYLDIKNPVDAQAAPTEKFLQSAVSKMWELRTNAGLPPTPESIKNVTGGLRGVLKTNRDVIDMLRENFEGAQWTGKEDTAIQQQYKRNADNATIKFLKQNGYDGIKHFGLQDGPVWVAFDPEQVIPVAKGRLPEWYKQMYAKQFGRQLFEPPKIEPVKGAIKMDRSTQPVDEATAKPAVMLRDGTVVVDNKFNTGTEGPMGETYWRGDHTMRLPDMVPREQVAELGWVDSSGTFKNDRVDTGELDQFRAMAKITQPAAAKLDEAVEKKFAKVMQFRLQTAIGKSLAAERKLPLVEAEYVRRQAQVVKDAAGGAPTFAQGADTTTADPRDAAVVDLIRHAKAGGRVDLWSNPADGVPVFAPTKMPALNRFIENVIMRPFNQYVTEEAATKIRGDVGQQMMIRHRGEQIRQETGAMLDKIFPYGGDKNVGLLGQIGAASKNPLIKAMAMEGFNEQQKYAIEKTLKDLFDKIGKETVSAGIMKEDELLTDYFTRIFDPPVNRPKASVADFIKGRLDQFQGPVKKDAHTIERVFDTFEQALNAGYRPKVNSLSAVVQSYIVSRYDSLATSLSRKAVIDRLQELKLISENQPSPAWIKIRGGGEDFNGKYVPPDVYKMIRPVFEKQPDLRALQTVEKWNYLSKRFGLGLDFYNYMQGLRGVWSVNANPFTLKAFYKAADKMQTENPQQVEEFVQNGLRMGEVPERIMRDEVAERDRWLSGDRRVLDYVKHPFYLVEEKTARDIFGRAKLGAMIKEYYPAAQDMQNRLGRELTVEERNGLQQKIAAQVNNIFGGLSYATMGRSPVAKALARLTLLSPDWTESRLRLYANAFGQMGDIASAPFRQVLGGEAGAISSSLRKENTVALRSATKLFAEVLLATEAMNFAFNGHGTDKNENGNEFKVQLPFETRYGTHPNINLWGYSEIPVRMLYHMAKLQPEAFFNERNSPAMRLAMTWLANRDPFGKELQGYGLPASLADQKTRILLEKAITSTGMILPSIVGDAAVGIDRSMKDGTADAISLGRAIGNFVSVKVGSNYPTELHERIDFLNNTEAWHKAQYKNLRSQGDVMGAIQTRQEWNDQVNNVLRMIKSDPLLYGIFGKRYSLIERMKI